jgi:hypothetical protein
MQQLGIDLTEHVPQILRVSAEVLAETLAETPLSLPPDHTLEPLAEVILDLADASLLHPHDPAAHERKVAAAVRYGELRRQEGAPERVIFAEFAALREALRRYLGRCGRPRPTVREARIRLDMASSVAELAAIRGYHRAEFERVGLWETLTVRLARESPLLDLPLPS